MRVCSDAVFVCDVSCGEMLSFLCAKHGFECVVCTHMFAGISVVIVTCTQVRVDALPAMNVSVSVCHSRMVVVVDPRRSASRVQSAHVSQPASEFASVWLRSVE